MSLTHGQAASQPRLAQSDGHGFGLGPTRQQREPVGPERRVARPGGSLYELSNGRWRSREGWVRGVATQRYRTSDDAS
jgi:hypothetical protein